MLQYLARVYMLALSPTDYRARLAASSTIESIFRDWFVEFLDSIRLSNT